MHVREATVKDVKDISRIYAQSWKAAYAGLLPQAFLDTIDDGRWVEKFNADIGGGALSALMIMDGGRPAGCAAFGRSREESRTGWGELVSVYLHPDYFGAGYGQALLEAAMHKLREQGHERVFLWVLRENSRARRFYEKNGFAPSGEENALLIMGQSVVNVRYVHIM